MELFIINTYRAFKNYYYKSAYSNCLTFHDLKFCVRHFHSAIDYWNRILIHKNTKITLLVKNLVCMNFTHLRILPNFGIFIHMQLPLPWCKECLLIMVANCGISELSNCVTTFFTRKLLNYYFRVAIFLFSGTFIMLTHKIIVLIFIYFYLDSEALSQSTIRIYNKLLHNNLTYTKRIFDMKMQVFRANSNSAE